MHHLVGAAYLPGVSSACKASVTNQDSTGVASPVCLSKPSLHFCPVSSSLVALSEQVLELLVLTTPSFPALFPSQYPLLVKSE